MPDGAHPAAAASRHLRHLRHVFPTPTLTFCLHILLALHTCLSNTEKFLHKDLTKPQEALIWQQKKGVQPLVPPQRNRVGKKLKERQAKSVVLLFSGAMTSPLSEKNRRLKTKTFDCWYVWSRLPLQQLTDFSCRVFHAFKSRSANLQLLRLLLLQQQAFCDTTASPCHLQHSFATKIKPSNGEPDKCGEAFIWYSHSEYNSDFGTFSTVSKQQADNKKLLWVSEHTKADKQHVVLIDKAQQHFKHKYD